MTSIAIPGISLNKKNKVSSPIYRWNIKKANWTKFYSVMEDLTHEAYSREDFSYDTFTTNLTKASEQAIPKINPSNSSGEFKKHWWCPKCQIAVNNRKEKMQIYKNNPTLNNFLQYKNAAAIVKKTILDSKRTTWRNFCTGLNKNTPIKQVWAEIGKLKGAVMRDKQHISTGDWSKEFLDILTPPFVTTNSSTLFPLQNETHSHSEYLTAPINFRELELALKQHNNTSPGMDQIHYPMLFYLPNNAKSTLITIFNNILHHSKPPSQWLKFKIIPILKPNKDKQLATSYRPISLASCILKTFERIVKNRLTWWLSEKKLWPTSQYGFRKNYSTNDALIELTLEIQQAFSKNKSVMALFLDIKGAYDSVQLNLLATKMKDIGIPDQIVKLLYNLYNNRELYLFTPELVLGPQTAKVGLPQGTILSPLSYVLFTYDLEKILSDNVKIIQYADDVCLYVTHDSVESCVQSLDRSLAKVSQWMNTNGLEISYNKTFVTTFSYSHTEFPEYVILNNTRISHNYSVKFLGLHMDRKLTWRGHITSLVQQLEKSINVLRMVSSLRWGADPMISLLFYRSSIRSKIDYGSLAYGSACNSLLGKLDVVHNKCLRLCVGLLRDTPINALLSEAGELPLKLRRKKLGISYLISCYRKSSTITTKIYELFLQDLTARFWITKRSPPLVEYYYAIQPKIHEITNAMSDNIDSLNYSEMISPLNCRYFNFSTNHPSQTYNHELINFLNTHYKNYYTFYTDGSSKDGKYGCSWYDSQTGTSKKFSLNKIMSVYSSELIAILECLEHIEQTQRSNMYLIITDSKSAVDQIKNITFRSSVNPIIIKIVQVALRLNTIVKFLWIRGHAGVTGNEIVDNLAKQGCDQNLSVNNLIAITDLRSSLIKDAISENLNIYRQYNKGLFYLSIQDSPCEKPWFSHTSIRNKHFIKTISRLRTNHGVCAKYLHLINKSPTDLCICGEVGDLEHIIMICPNFDNERKVLFDAVTNLLPTPFNYKTLLMLKNEQIYALIYQFISKNGLNI